MARNDGWWIELDSAGVRQILNSPEVAGMVKRAAQNAAKAARANGPKGVSVQVHSGQTRSGVRSSAIVTVPAKTEANHGILAKAIGAAKKRMPNILDATVAYLDDCLQGLDDQMPAVWVTAAKADKELYQVVIRDDGGQLLDYPRATAYLGINVYAPTEAEADRLANHVRWTLSEWAAGNPVILAKPSLPHQIADLTPRRYLTAELTILLGKTNI